MTRELLDEDGENQAVRCFLMLYGGTNSPTTKQMRNHLDACGYPYWPEWASGDDGHLTKGGAQDWLRHLFSLEVAAPSAPVEQAAPEQKEPEQATQPRDKWQKLDFDYNDKDRIRTFHVTAYEEGAESWKAIAEGLKLRIAELLQQAGQPAPAVADALQQIIAVLDANTFRNAAEKENAITEALRIARNAAPTQEGTTK